jgi:dTDP-4-dehydrorhamnose reductase
MRWLVTGASGQLGAELVELLGARSADVIGLDRTALDVTDEESVVAALTTHRPDIVVNTAAFTNVDGAESEPDSAASVNATAPGLLASAARAHGARLVHVSTDYVFSGRDAAGRPYDEDDPTDPINVYGRTKRDGELAVLATAPDAWVVRTSWVYGGHGANFVRSIIRLLDERPTLDVVDDQEGSPTWAFDLANGLVELVERDAPAGTYHATNEGDTSRYEQARAVATLIGADPDRIRPSATSAAPRPAARPAWSVLGHRRWREEGLTPLPSWDVALAQALRDPRLAGEAHR